jgi:hypothetical protein
VLLLALTTAETIGLVALGVTCATFLVAASTLFLNVRWRRRAGYANLVAEGHRLYENPKAPAGWQVIVNVRNSGVAPAYAPDLWIEPGNRYSYEDRRIGRQGEKLLPGEGARLFADLPSKPGDVEMHAMLGWEDSRGIQKRESGIPLDAGAGGRTP